MRFILAGSNVPAYNLASEEYFLYHSVEPVVMLWQNTPAVIIGRNQNAYAEVDTSYVAANGIDVVRRLTGGGAVYHDGGNICFTFIAPKTSEGIDFKPFTDPVIDALASMGVTASLNGRNDITVQRGAQLYKISGNAQCTVTNNSGVRTVMSHGTLLFSTDMTVLSRALKPDPEKIASKGIASVRSRVMNIGELLPEETCAGFFEKLTASFAAKYGVSERCGADENEAILALARDKYSTWEWNFGVSRQFSAEHRKRYPFGSVTVSYTADRGVLSGVQISGDFFGEADVALIERALCGARLDAASVMERLDGMGIPVGECISGCDAETLIELILK